ncbi:MAG: hypothetical protein V3R45_02710 [Candidatus Aminicenantaceae bacterium]
MRKKIIVIGCVTFLTAIILVSCTSAPDIMPEPEPKPETKPAAHPEFDMKPFHEAMNAEMRISFERADEVIIGVYSGNHNDEQFGLIHYFDDFKSFDKTSMSWGEEMKVIVQVQTDELKPEIIKKNEFYRLSDLDKVGICWDSYEQTRYVYLVEGQKILIFLQTGYDESLNRSYRNMIDAYPITPACRADDVFDLIIHNLN